MQVFNAIKGCIEEIGQLSLPNHSTRHTHAVMLLDACADMNFGQERLGYGFMKITLDVYAHVSNKIAASSIEKFDE